MIYKELRKYSRQLICSHFIKTGETVTTICVNDLVNEAICNEVNNLEEAKKIMRTYLLSEVRRLKAKRQYSSISQDYEKLCKSCNKIKHQSEFKHRIDKINGLHYLYYMCLDCEHEYNTSEERKARKRELYNNSPRAKQKAHERYIRWKNKNKN